MEKRGAHQPPTPRDNHLLRALADAEYNRLQGNLHLEYLELGKIILETGQGARFAYFPTTALVSLLSVMEDGSAAEIAITGRDGVVGVSLFMGGIATTTRAIVQSGGYAYRLDAEALSAEFVRGGQMHAILLRYMQALMTQMVQTAACNRHHSVEQQLCRWLLLSLDLLPSDEVVMTHDLIANMLGVRRAGVSVAAAKLQADAVIHYRRGRIQVIDRSRLEKCSCECYAVVKREVARLLPEFSDFN